MSKNNSKHRDGMLVICVLVCLLVASAIVTATTQSALRSRREVRLQQQMRQTELLLDAGVLRAARQLRESGDFDGELWHPAAAITHFENARVEIRVTVDQQQPDFRLVEVQASLGVAVDDEQETASLTRRSHRFRFEISNSSSPESTDSNSTDSPSAE